MKNYAVKHLEVRKKYQDYLVWLFQKINNFPRKQKFLLGERIGTTALDVLCFLVTIQYAPKEEKARLIRAFNLKLETLRELMRLAWRMNFLSHKTYLWQEARIDEVGRMAHGVVFPKREDFSMNL